MSEEIVLSEEEQQIAIEKYKAEKVAERERTKQERESYAFLIIPAVFLELTGREMTDKEYKAYRDKMEEAEAGYNIKKFISELNNG